VSTEHDDEPQREPGSPAKRPLQFGIGTLLAVMTAVCILFSVLRWLGVSSSAAAMVLVILIAAAAAGLGLMFAIAQGDDEPR
jgi:hypothetical protein